MTTLLMLTGPAGSGKSTAAAAWASRGTSPRSLIDTDALRWLIRAGVAHPEHGWTQETQRQWDVAMDLWKAMVRVYKLHGIDCVVDIYAPPCPPETGDDIMTELGIRRIVLLPSLEVCLARNLARNRNPLLEDSDLRSNYEDFAWCVRRHNPHNVIDNSALTVDETVEAIDAVLRESATS
ncbi:AAA family ATPase [Actinopolymorpha alba]|uniref:AAA family ATPase n=1 Tax=Actinopolymorpha alba TaxID=533267 RepID=UPI0012F66A88|nr:AAA family ATPase [Actinopolymorpha alba]